MFSKITVPNDHKTHPNIAWDCHGVAFLPGLIPGELIDAYVEERKRLIGGTPKWRTGWNDPTPYMRVRSMLDIACHRPLTEEIKPLIGWKEPGLHLCLTGFQSTERAWHQDRYLNPEYVGEKYIAAWIALDDIHEDSGPFEWIPGSHLWPVIERSKVWEEMRARGQDPNLPTWPSDSEGWVGAACEEEIRRQGVTKKAFYARRGDVLLWHASLVHRGSKPRNAELERRSLICHYSAIDARPDMPHLRRMENGSFYFWFEHGLREPMDSTHR